MPTHTDTHTQNLKNSQRFKSPSYRVQSAMILWFFRTAIFLSEVLTLLPYLEFWGSETSDSGHVFFTCRKRTVVILIQKCDFLTQGHTLFKYPVVTVLLTNVSVKFSPFYSNGVQYQIPHFITVKGPAAKGTSLGSITMQNVWLKQLGISRTENKETKEPGFPVRNQEVTLFSVPLRVCLQWTRILSSIKAYNNKQCSQSHSYVNFSSSQSLLSILYILSKSIKFAH